MGKLVEEATPFGAKVISCRNDRRGHSVALASKREASCGQALSMREGAAVLQQDRLRRDWGRSGEGPPARQMCGSFNSAGAAEENVWWLASSGDRTKIYGCPFIG